MVNLFTWEAGPCFLGSDVWSGNVVYKCSEAGIELLPVFAPESMVFALMKGDRMIAALKLERDAADAGFMEELRAIIGEERAYRI